MINAAVLQNAMADASRQMITVGGLALALLGLAIGYMRINPARRARNGVERVMLVGIAAASTVAILTTAGIVLSMLFETLHFFSHVRADGLLLRHRLGPALLGGGARRWSGGPVRPAAVAVGHALHLHRRAFGCRSGRAVLGGLHVGIRQQDRAHDRQAAARDPGRHPDHRLRLLRARHLRAVRARPWRLDRASASRRRAC